MKTHLNEAAISLLDVIGQDVVSICESNSLRQVVQPGLFLIVKKHDSKAWKKSAEDVKKYADRIVVSDRAGFDFDISRIKLTGGKWTIKEKATAIILAGGSSGRMGTDKSLLPIKSKPIVEHICEQLCDSFEQILISANEVDKLAFLGFEVVTDRQTGQGPLMGIASALEASENELNFVVACDIPDIDLKFVKRLLTEAQEADIVIPTADGNEKLEPLFAVYRKSTLGVINEVLSSGGRKISDVFSRCNVRYVKMKAGQITNLNTMDEYEQFRKKYDA
jgi:molybdopterin-guanine dinucleotide biosynthesis protein A